MSEFHVSIGESARFTKTVGETDVYLFAGITGDFAPNHVDKTYMARTKFGRLQAHGALMVGFMSTAAGMVASRTADIEVRNQDQELVGVGSHILAWVRNDAA